MITIIFCTDKSGLCGFDISGHSGYAEAGSDIVCAAVTSAVRYAECVMNDVLCCSVPFEVCEESAGIKMNLGSALSQSKRSYCSALLQVLREYFGQLEEEYPDYIEVSEV